MKHDNNLSEIIEDVMKAAEQGAMNVAIDRPDVIEEARNEVGLRWKKRQNRGDLPLDSKAWAFISGRNQARRILTQNARYVEITDSITDTLIEPSQEAILIETMQPINWLHADEAIGALSELINIATRIIEEKGDVIDQQILDLHYKTHWTFMMIAEKLEITEDCARKRWSRLMWGIIDDIMKTVRADQRLATIFSVILEDTDDFRASILGLFAIVSAKGFSALEAAAHSILPSK